MQMDETRKRQLIAGIVVGAVTVGVIMILRRTPRGKRSATFGNIARDALKLVKARYGSNEVTRLAERAVDRVVEGA